MTDNGETWMRAIIFSAALIGAAGVGAAAGASHDGGSRNIAAISTICLAHGPALIGMAVAINGFEAIRWAALLLVLGTLVFAGDLALREWMGHPLFPGAAPLGGGLMILGWGGAAVAMLVRKKAIN